MQAERCFFVFGQGHSAVEAAGIIAQLADASGSGGSQAAKTRDKVAQRLQTSLAVLLRALNARLRNPEFDGRRYTPGELAQLLHLLVKPAAELGAAVLAYFDLPEQQAAAGLALARIAASHSCAYLRCSNLEAAGSDRRGRRCSVCKAVQCLQGGTVLRYRLQPRRLARRAQEGVQGAGGGA